MLSTLLCLYVFVAVTNSDNVVETPRIRGGHAATKPYPYQVSLQANATVYDLEDVENTFNDWAHWCGGSIITNRVIVTAAHCLTDFNDLPIPQEYYSVFAGSLSLDGDGDRYCLRKNLTHPQYTTKGQNYDIALITTATEIKFTKNRVAPIAFSKLTTKRNTECVVTGWGNMGHDGNGVNPVYLQELKQHTLNNRECQLKISGVTKTDICAFSEKGQGHCNGDSGGPLVNEQKQILVGIVSRAIKCGHGTPDIYTRVSFFYNWIQDYLNN